MSALLQSALEGGVLRLTLSDAATRNSLSEAMMAALTTTLDNAAADKAVRIIVLAAEGPAFSSGHNLKEISAHRADADRGAAYFASLFDACARLMMGIVGNPRPVIAEVSGLASAAGCQLVATCDLAIASDTARFCTPGVNIGLFCSTPMVALSRNLSNKAAMHMLLTGEPVSADEAKALGLVNTVVGIQFLTETAMSLAAKIAAKPRATVKTGKEAFYHQREMPLAQAYDYATQLMTENMLAAEAEEGICAFIEKREPKWPE